MIEYDKEKLEAAARAIDYEFFSKDDGKIAGVATEAAQAALDAYGVKELERFESCSKHMTHLHKCENEKNKQLQSKLAKCREALQELLDCPVMLPSHPEVEREVCNIAWRKAQTTLNDIGEE